MNSPALLIWKMGINPATETRPARAWLSGKPNLALAAAIAPLRSQDTVVEDGIFDVLLEDGSLPRNGKPNTAVAVLDAFPGKPYHPAKTDEEGNVVTDANGKAVVEKHQVVRITLVIAKPIPAPAAE